MNIGWSQLTFVGIKQISMNNWPRLTNLYLGMLSLMKAPIKLEVLDANISQTPGFNHNLH